MKKPIIAIAKHQPEVVMKINLKATFCIYLTAFSCLTAGSLFANDETIGTKVDDGISKVEKTTKSATDKTKEIAKEAKYKAEEIAEDSKDKTKELGESMKESAKKVKKEAKKEAKKSKHQSKKHS